MDFESPFLINGNASPLLLVVFSFVKKKKSFLSHIHLRSAVLREMEVFIGLEGSEAVWNIEYLEEVRARKTVDYSLFYKYYRYCA